MRAPLIALYVDQHFQLEEEDFGGKFSGSYIYDHVLDVHKVHAGEPNNFDRLAVSEFFDFSDGRYGEDGLTVICTIVGDTRGFLLYFPDEEQEIEFVNDFDDDDFA